MTDAETNAGALSAGVDLIVPAPMMSDIKATAAELAQHIEDVHLSTQASTWLDDARSALANAVHFIESHFAYFEAKLKSEFVAADDTVKSEVSAAEANVRTEVGALEAKIGEPLSSVEAAAAGAATAASAV